MNSDLIYKKVLEEVMSDGLLLSKYLEHNNHLEIVWAAIKNNGLALQYVNQNLKTNHKLVEEAINNNIKALQYTPLNNDRDFLYSLNIRLKNNQILKYVSEELKYDIKFIKGIVYMTPSALEYAVDKIKDVDYIIKTAISSDHRSFQYVNPLIKNNFLRMLDYIQGTTFNCSVDKSVLKYLGNDLKNNKEFGLIAVSRNGYFLKFLSEKLKDNKEVVWTAITENGNALEFASKRLKNDKETVLKAASTLDHNQYGNDDTENNNAFKHASLRLKSDLNMLLDILKYTEKGIYEASKKVFSNLKMVNELMKIDDSIIYLVSENIRSDKEVMSGFLDKSYNVFNRASEDLRNDSEFVLLALNKTNLQNPQQLIGNDLKEKVGNSDVRTYCESYLLTEKLSNNLPQKSKTKQLKI